MIAVTMLLTALVVPIAHASIQITETFSEHTAHALGASQHGHSHDDDLADELPESHLLSHNPVDHSHETQGIVFPLNNTAFHTKPTEFHHVHPDRTNGLVYGMERPPRSLFS